MDQVGIFIGWNRVVPGKESQSVELVATALDYCRRQVERGELGSVEPVALSANNGKVNGFLLLRGEIEQLYRVRSDPEFQRLVVRSNVVLEDLGVLPAYIGDGFTYVMDQYRDVV